MSHSAHRAECPRAGTGLGHCVWVRPWGGRDGLPLPLLGSASLSVEQKLSGSHKALVEMQDVVAELLKTVPREYPATKVSGQWATGELDTEQRPLPSPYWRSVPLSHPSLRPLPFFPCVHPSAPWGILVAF